MNVETITLEDNKTYMITHEKGGYVYLTNIDDPKDFCIRKTILKDGEEFIETLDAGEFDEALKLFINI